MRSMHLEAARSARRVRAPTSIPRSTNRRFTWRTGSARPTDSGGWGSTSLVRFDPDFSWSLIARPDGITECEWCWYDLAPDGAVWTLTETGVSRYNPSGSWTDYPFDEAPRRVLFDPQSGPTPWSGSLDWSSGGELTTWVMDAEQQASSPQWLRLDSSRSGSTTVEGWPMDAATAAIDRECLEVEFASALAGELVDLDEILASEEETLRFVGNVARGLEAAPDGTAYAAFTCVGVTHLLADGTADVTPASELPSPHISDLTVGPRRHGVGLGGRWRHDPRLIRTARTWRALL